MWSMSSSKALLSVLALVTLPAFEARILSGKAKQLKREDPKEEKKEKPMEDPITIMRGELCWGRDKMIGHSDCMEWLVTECTTHSFGTGLCNRVSKHVKEECEEGKEKEACHYAKLLGIVIDSDGDGVPDEDDAFPDDPKETKDTDGDGVGDHKDECPDDPKFQKKPCSEPAPAPAPPPVAAPAPAPAPAKKEEAPAPAPKKEKEAPVPAAPAPAAPEPKKDAPAPAAAAEEAPKAYVEPDAKDGLQSQGFTGKKVIHVDGETVVSDWGKEYGHEHGSHHHHSGSTRLWQPHALILAVGALTLAFSA